ncbi:MAG: hypothetical protein NVSMB44_30840 [Ktedonobacteraceae bacterium]
MQWLTRWLSSKHAAQKQPDEHLIAESECEQLFHRLHALRAQISPLPAQYHAEGKAQLSQWPDRFDANRYFEVFDHIHLKPGYTLDYVFRSFYYPVEQGHYKWGNPDSGEILLYTRKVSSRRLTSAKPFGPRFVGEPWPVPGLSFDRSASGFWQFAVFCLEAPQFYLHGDHEHLQWVGTRQQLEAILTSLPVVTSSAPPMPGTITQKARQHLSTLEVQPRVRIWGHSAEVVGLAFGVFRGFVFQHCQVSWPNCFHRLQSEPEGTYTGSIRPVY